MMAFLACLAMIIFILVMLAKAWSDEHSENEENDRKRTATRTWNYRCFGDCADQVVRWVREHPEFKARRSRGPSGWDGWRPHVVTIKGPADAVLPEPGEGIVAAWGVNAPWQNGLPLGYEVVPRHVKDQLLARNREVRERWEAS